jgi:hypothetical protein
VTVQLFAAIARTDAGSFRGRLSVGRRALHRENAIACFVEADTVVKR